MKISIPAFVGHAWNVAFVCLEKLGANVPRELPRRVQTRSVSASYEPMEVVQVKTSQPGFYVEVDMDENSLRPGNLFDVIALRAVFTRNNGIARLVISLDSNDITALIQATDVETSKSTRIAELKEKWSQKVQQYFSPQYHY